MKKVYRFEHKNPDLGLWYMKNGEKSGVIEKLGLSNKEMPMGRDDAHYIAPSGHKYHCSAPDMKTLLLLKRIYSFQNFPINYITLIYINQHLFTDILQQIKSILSF